MSNDEFVVVHRLIVSDAFIGKGVAKLILDEVEKYAVRNNIYSIKVDTNFDNLGMLHLLSTKGYTYCGEVLLRDNARKAFEKLLQSPL